MLARASQPVARAAHASSSRRPVLPTCRLNTSVTRCRTAAAALAAVAVTATARSSRRCRRRPRAMDEPPQAASSNGAPTTPTPPAAPKRVLVPVADGTEEMEAVVMIDVLRRAGVSVVVASVERGGRLAVACSRGVVLTADATIEAALSGGPTPFDLIALPGGMPGAERLAASAPLSAALRAQREAGRPFAAICAAPAVVLEAQGLLPPGQPATAHPAFSARLSNQACVAERVAVASGGEGGGGGLVVTSRGPGTAFEFTLALVALLCGGDKAREVAAPMVMHGGWEDGVAKVVEAVAGAAAKAGAQA